MDPSGLYVSARRTILDPMSPSAAAGLDIKDVQAALEADGLDALRKGDELFVRDHRMLGAVRATKQCLECHGGNRGDLLGAFSYTLRPAGKKSE